MYKGFNLKLENTSKLKSDGRYSEELKANKKKIKSKFKELMLSDGYLDAEELMKAWFPKNEYHVFISHSHKDVEIAECLANWLHENFGLKSFIDSHVWGYANELLKELNDLNALEKTLLKNGFEESRTASPWVMSELKISSLIRKKLSRDWSVAGMESITDSAKFLYSAPTDHLSELSEEDLVDWLNDCTTSCGNSGSLSIVLRHCYDALDKLYEQAIIEA